MDYCLKELEGEPGEPRTLELAQRMSQKLLDLDSEFRTDHHALFDLIDDEDSLARQQDVLDAHDDLIAELVIGTLSPVASGSSRRIASRKLTHMQKSLASILRSSAIRLPLSLTCAYSVSTRKRPMTYARTSPRPAHYGTG